MNALEPSIRESLVLAHVPLLRHITGRMGLPHGVDRGDLLGWGMIGLLAAADTFDESRGLKFSTYAYPKIRGAILDALRRADVLPRERREALQAIERAAAVLEQELGAPPTPEEIAERCELSAEDVDEALAMARVAVESSLDEGWSVGSLGALLSDPRSDDPVGTAEWEEMKLLLAASIQELPEPERTVILLYYGEEMLLRDIGDVLGVSESRVSQIHSKAVYRLNRKLVLTHGGDPPMIDAVDRAPTRILKCRDLAEAAPPRAETLVGLTAGTRAPSANAPGSAAAAHTGAKEVRILPGENGTSALEVRCSCGELTRVEIQLGGNAKPEGVR